MQLSYPQYPTTRKYFFLRPQRNSFEYPFVFTNVKIPSYVYVSIAYFNIALFRLFIGLSIVEVLIVTPNSTCMIISATQL